MAAAGGVPVLLPPLPGIEEAVSRLDALVLSGGGDIDPAAYGADPHPLTERVYPARDQAERALAGHGPGGRGAGARDLPRAADRQRVPWRHAPPAPARRGGPPRPRIGGGTYGSHPVRIAAGSLLGRILGPAEADGQVRAVVPTSHHQAIGRLGDGLVATAWADDGTIEAVEPDPAANGGTGFLLAVQWHPEAGDDPRLFEALISSARRRAGSGKPAGAEPLDSRA